MHSVQVTVFESLCDSFDVFAAHCTDGSEIWHGGADIVDSSMPSLNLGFICKQMVIS